ncbi:MAG: bifunctional precorrin-2 dehydrogenase/sirohydrochlorin ferrochelatase [Candidatus Sumerlaeia bacterium]
MNILYPVFLKLENRPAVVVGGGGIALQKIRALLESKASITVISPELCEGVEALERENKIRVEKRPYASGDLEGFFIVICATDNRELNSRVRDEAREKRVLCNVVDDPELCDFYVPSIHTIGDLKLAISSNAKGPAISRKLRKDLGELYGPIVAEALEIMNGARQNMKRDIPDYKERGRILSEILGEQPLYEMEKEGDAALQRLREALKQWI